MAADGSKRVRVARRGAVAWRGLALSGCLAAAAGCGLGGGSYTPVRTAFNRGVHLASAGEFEAALAEYRDALREDPEDYRARFNLASTMELLADRGEQARDLDAAARWRRAARAQYEAVLRSRPGELRASINLALREYGDGDAAAARRRLEATIDRYPNDARALAARARIELLSGSSDAAERSLTAARDRDPTDAATCLMLGDLQRARGALTEARATFRAALARDDASVAVLRALGELEAVV